MLTCVHHVQWVRPVAGGLHQCTLCQQVVTKKDVYPKPEDLGPEFLKRWDAHEATAGAAPSPARPPPAAKEASAPAKDAPAPAKEASAPATDATAPPREARADAR